MHVHNTVRIELRSWVSDFYVYHVQTDINPREFYEERKESNERTTSLASK